MRRKLATITVAGALVLGGAALAGPALAESGTEGAAEAVSARVERIADALGGLVSEGAITQEQADEVATALAEELPGPGGRGGPGGHGPGLLMGLDAAADALSLTPEELRAALAEDGASLASVAEDQGVATEDLVDALVAAAQQHLDEEVAEGGLAQEEADERAADLEARVAELVQRSVPAPGERGPGGPRGGPLGPGTGPTGDGTTGDGTTEGGSAEDGTTATASGWSYAA